MIDADDIKQRADCRAACRARGVRIRGGRGDNLRAHCWHPDRHNNGDANPSLTIYKDGYRCYGCGASGSVIDAVMELDGVDFKGALATLADELHLDPADAQRARAGRGAQEARAAKKDAERLPAIDPIRAEIWGRIWQALAAAEQPEAPKCWAAERGIDPQVLAPAGVLDPTHAADEVIAILRSYRRPAHLAAGTINHDIEPWHPLDIIKSIQRGDRVAADGVFVPIWSPLHRRPVGVRYRLYQAWKNGPKSLAQYSGAPVLPLGLDTLAGEGSWEERTGRPRSVLLCEGETDWLAAQDAMRRLGRPAACLAHCMMSKAWEPAWTRLIAEAAPARVLVLFDGDAAIGEARAGEVASQLADLRGETWTRRHLTVHLTEPGEDLADLHQKGALVSLFGSLTPENP